LTVLRPVDNAVRNLSDWSKVVRGRDGRCTNCGTDKALVAHHIFPKSTHPERALDPANGLTLCSNCHTEHHKSHYGKINVEKSKAKRAKKNERIARLSLENAKLKLVVVSLKAEIAEYEHAYLRMLDLKARKK
jgi:5-methylcytosine-specific restriction endonuclease McrA